MFKVALIGKYNVGKSIIFNKLIDKNKLKYKTAVSFDFKGLTRDRNEAIIKVKEIDVKLIDTPGISNDRDEMVQKMNEQTLISINESDLILFILDNNGILEIDNQIINKIKNLNKKVHFFINKCDIKDLDLNLFKNLNEELFLISAQHNINFHKIKDVIFENLIDYRSEIHNEFQPLKVNNIQNSIKICILGRPNVGKSTFINRIIGEERLIASPIPGTTRDAISVFYKYNDVLFEFIDTAGIRRKTKIDKNSVEALFVEKSIESLNFCHVCILMMDIENSFEDQDLSLAMKAIKEGRILIILLNKWDIVTKGKDQDLLLKKINDFLSKKLNIVKDLTFFTVSAKNDKNFEELFNEIISLYKKWCSKCNSKDLKSAVDDINLAKKNINRRFLKVKSIIQIKSRPPVFKALINQNPKDVPSYLLNYIRNKINEKINLNGISFQLRLENYKEPKA